MCTNIVIHMNLSISIRRSISIHVSISITMSNFACLLGWSLGILQIFQIFQEFQDFPGQVPRIPRTPRIPRFSWPSPQKPKNSKIFLAISRNMGFFGLGQSDLGILGSLGILGILVTLPGKSWNSRELPILGGWRFGKSRRGKAKTRILRISGIHIICTNCWVYWI